MAPGISERQPFTCIPDSGLSQLWNKRHKLSASLYKMSLGFHRIRALIILLIGSLSWKEPFNSLPITGKLLLEQRFPNFLDLYPTVVNLHALVPRAPAAKFNLMLLCTHNNHTAHIALPCTPSPPGTFCAPPRGQMPQCVIEEQPWQTQLRYSHQAMFFVPLLPELTNSMDSRIQSRGKSGWHLSLACKYF